MRRRRALIVLAVATLAGAALLVAGGLQGTLVYYRSPTEVKSTPPPVGERFRLGGEVVPGSVIREGDRIQFVLRDAQATVPVILDSSVPGSFREGQEAVVEGAFDADRVFVSQHVEVKHSNEYRARSDAP